MDVWGFSRIARGCTGPVQGLNRDCFEKLPYEVVWGGVIEASGFAN